MLCGDDIFLVRKHYKYNNLGRITFGAHSRRLNGPKGAIITSSDQKTRGNKHAFRLLFQRSYVVVLIGAQDHNHVITRILDGQLQPLTITAVWC